MTAPVDNTEPPGNLYPFPDRDPYETVLRHEDTTRRHADPQAERALLAALLTPDADRPTLLAELGSILKPGDLYTPAHELIYDTITQLVAAGTPVDPVTIAHHLNTTHRGDRTTPLALAALPDLITTPTVPASATHYAGIIREHARLRAAEHAILQAQQRLRDGDPDTVWDALGGAMDTIEEVLRRDAAPHLTTPTSWAPVDLTQVLAGEYLDPPPTMLIRADGVPLLYDGAVHTISGESESGKTWLTLLAALQLLTDGHRVVFIDFEDRADRVIGRLLALGASPDHIRQHFAYIRPDRPLDDDGRHQLQPHLTGARLAIIDGVTEAMTTHGYDLNSNADSALFQALLPRWIADHGPAVVMIDHVVKDKEKQDRFALGAQHKLAGIDGAAYIVKCLQPFGRGKTGLARVDVAKDRPGHVREHTHGRGTIAEFTLDASADGLVLQAFLNPPGTANGRSSDTFEPTHLMEKISRYVQVNPGMSKKSIEGAMNGKASTIRLALELLVTRGYIGVKTGARGAVQHFHVRPYFEDPEAQEAYDHSGPSNPESEDR